MLVSTSTETAKRTEATYMVDDQPYKGWEYIGVAPKPGTPGYGEDIAGEAVPQGYLVMQPPHSVTRPHFHQTNQFQVFVGGGGTVGKVRVDPLTVQYAGGNTPYGPIQAEAEGVDYFTLRQTWDSGAKYLPANRDLLVKGQQRQVVGVKGKNGPEKRDGDATLDVLIEATEDGLFAQTITLPAGAVYTLPDSAEGGGQYHVVVSGSLARNGAHLPPLSIEFASPDEGAVAIEAGPDGLELLLARFPKLAA